MTVLKSRPSYENQITISIDSDDESVARAIKRSLDQFVAEASAKARETGDGDQKE